MGIIIKYSRLTITIIANIFSPKPHFAISGIVTWPLARILALGPVPEGSIKAQEAAMVAGIINKYGMKVTGL